MMPGKTRHCCALFYGNYLFCCYMTIKLVYLGNVVTQILWLNIFLGMDYHLYGFK